jgi:hypothetical protein
MSSTSPARMACTDARLSPSLAGAQTSHGSGVPFATRARHKARDNRIVTGLCIPSWLGSPDYHHTPATLRKLSILHWQQLKGRLETLQRRHSISPAAYVDPALQIKSAYLREGHVCVAE